MDYLEYLAKHVGFHVILLAMTFGPLAIILIFFTGLQLTTDSDLIATGRSAANT